MLAYTARRLDWVGLVRADLFPEHDPLLPRLLHGFLLCMLLPLDLSLVKAIQIFLSGGVVEGDLLDGACLALLGRRREDGLLRSGFGEHVG